MASRNNQSGAGGGATEADCDYVYKGKRAINHSQRGIVVLSGDMGVGKSNILQR
jgi:tRNA A37 threonylcarbamoyladenosine biosynthesis protein TsaE